MNPILELLSELSRLDVEYCSWKNNYLLEDTIAGGRDLDLLINPSKESIVKELLRVNSWFRLENPSCSISGVEHYYFLSYPYVYHIHLYIRLITGHSWIKEYEILSVLEVLNSRVKDQTTGVYTPSRDTEVSLYYLRKELKNRSLTGRLLRWADPEPASVEENYIASIAKENNFCKDLTVVRRLNKLSSAFLIGFSFANRVLQKVFRYKKVIPNKGLVVVLCGPDGCGKSTILKELSVYLSKFMGCRSISLGRPYGRLLNFILDWKKSFKNESIVKANSLMPTRDRKPIWVRNTRNICTALLIANFRLLAYWKACLYKELGFIVLADRWIMSGEGGSTIDGPRLGLLEDIGLKAYMKKLEKTIYDQIRVGDLGIILDVSEDTVIRRNQARLKRGKETESEIRARYSLSQMQRPKVLKEVHIDNENTIEGSMAEVVKQINALLSSRDVG